jgi:Putative beta-barrel porin-2, OmpL-like. bbp2
MKTKFCSVLILTLSFLHAQKIALGQVDDKPSPFSISAYIETYYVYDFNKPENNTRPSFIYSYNRHNEVNLNLGFIRGSYTTDKVRANLALMTGTYANANLAVEPGVLKNIFEASAGIKLSSTKNLWIDAGIFASHIGFESAIGKDCWNLTRSILADNSPYYEAGAKISYTTDDGKWFLSGLILNGWQRIQRVDGNSLPSFGTQITFKPSESIAINSSSFIGTDKPDDARQMRYFHNLYGIFQISEKIGLTVGFDIGAEEKSPTESATNLWYSPVITAKYALTDKVSISVRGEYYQDEYGVIISTGTPNGFKTTGFSLNADYAITPNAVWRIEARSLYSKDTIFVRENQSVNEDTFLSTSIAISF